MQKSEKRLNSKSVGATSSRPHFEEITKGKKGITLIALIITIIVMMILVGVTVATAINGGLFETARKAARDTQIEADKEALLGAVLEALDTKTGTLDVDNITNLPEGWSNNGDGTYTSPDGNTFKVGETGKVELDEESTNPNPGGGTEPTPQPPAEDPIITTLNKFKTQSVIELLDWGSFDAEKGYYKINTSKHPELENLEDSEVYIIGKGAGAIVRDPNTNKDYIVKIGDDGIVKETILQPEEKITTVKEGVVALSNLEEFNTGANFFIGFEPTGEVIDGTCMTEFENSEINSIILSNVYYFNSLDDSMSIDGVVVDYLYVPVGFEQTIYADRPVNREFEFGGENADDVSSLNKIEIDGQEYYELHWSKL